MRMYLISDNTDTLTGMRLAGVDGVIANEKRNAGKGVERSVKRQKYRDHPAHRSSRKEVSGAG